MDKQKVENALQYAYEKILGNLDIFEEAVPTAVSKNYVYSPVENRDWTDGFWIGMLHLMQKYRKNEKISKVIQKQLIVFQERLNKKIVLNHHDIGFLYSLSAVADFIENGNQESRQMALQAADVLMRRYNEKAKIFQAWGDSNDKEQQGRMIIDCNMNLALLYFASDQTGNPIYREAAKNHIKNAQKYLVRADNSTFHTFFMDIETGEPRFGQTAQGFSDNSCWARGQAWGIYGFPISYNHIGDVSLLETSKKLADYFIEQLPEDLICYWDLIFTSGTEEKDTSAAAIAACGLLELSKNLSPLDENRKKYEQVALSIMENLIDFYTTKGIQGANGLLVQGVYSKPENLGVNECTLWGDYFYLEALIRLHSSCFSFW